MYRLVLALPAATMLVHKEEFEDEFAALLKAADLPNGFVPIWDEDIDDEVYDVFYVPYRDKKEVVNED